VPDRRIAYHQERESTTAHTETKRTLEAFKETLLSYIFDLGGLLAGFIVASQLGVFEITPWAIALYPAIVSAKGVIGGLLAGRLGTALHLGTVYPRFRKNTKSFYKLFQALIVVTLATSATMSLISLVFGTIFWGITPADFPAILAVVMSTMALGLSLTLITTKVAFVSFQKGLDPDIVVYPIMSTVADIFVTLYYVIILNLFFFTSIGKWAIALIAIGIFIVALRLLLKNLHESEFIKTVKESLVTMVFVAFIVNVTGTVLKGISEIVENRKEIYMVYPAMIDMIGDVGSVVGSTATTKLSLGLLKPSFSSIRKHASNIVAAWTASMVLFFILALSALFLSGNISLSAFANLLIILLVTNIIAGAAIILVSYGVAILTFKRGWDPDNFVIPIESSLADSITSVALLIVLLLVT
jgi:mgtE-like transporter